MEVEFGHPNFAARQIDVINRLTQKQKCLLNTFTQTLPFNDKRNQIRQGF